MAKRVVLHIGTGKTGTSSIQNFMYEHRQVLRARRVLDYPDAGLVHEEHYGERIHAHYAAVYWIVSSDKAGLRQLRKAIDASKCETVLLSCENFYHLLSPEQIDALAEVLKGLSTRIICYVRRQDLYIESAWKQQAKVGALRVPFSTFLSRHTSADHVEESHANYFGRLRPWRDAFGRESIAVRPFDPAVFRSGDLVTDFLDACGLDGDVTAIAALPRAAMTNQAIPSDLADLVRRTTVEQLVAPEDQQAYVAWLKSLGGYTNPPLLTSEDRRAILHNYRVVNRRLARDYMDEGAFALFRPSAIRDPDDAPQAEKGRSKRKPDDAMLALVRAWRSGAGKPVPAPAAPAVVTGRGEPVWPPAGVRGPLPFPPTINARQVAARVKQHMREARPLSVIRLGDGEATVIGYPEHVGEAPLGEFTRSWFGHNEIDRAQRLKLAQSLREAVRHADVIGVAGGHQVDKFTAVRHLMGIYALVADSAQIAKLSLHRNLQEEGLFEGLLTGLDEVGLVTCRDVAPMLKQRFGIGRVTSYRVPEAVKHATDQAAVARHFPDRFEELRRTLEVPRPGMLFLVGAGPCGKVYCQWIKERGGVALDIGSVFDGWDGRLTRLYMRVEGSDGANRMDDRYRLDRAR